MVMWVLGNSIKSISWTRFFYKFESPCSKLIREATKPHAYKPTYVLELRLQDHKFHRETYGEPCVCTAPQKERL